MLRKTIVLGEQYALMEPQSTIYFNRLERAQKAFLVSKTIKTSTI